MVVAGAVRGASSSSMLITRPLGPSTGAYGSPAGQHEAHGGYAASRASMVSLVVVKSLGRQRSPGEASSHGAKAASRVSRDTRPRCNQ